MGMHSLFSKNISPANRIKKAAPKSGGGDGNNASQVQCSQKSCIAIGREVAPVRSAFLDGSFLFSVWRGYEGALQGNEFDKFVPTGTV